MFCDNPSIICIPLRLDIISEKISLEKIFKLGFIIFYMGKRGLTHVEMILSFVIFVGFLIFALIFFNPTDVDRLLDSSLFYAVDEITSNVSVEIESFYVEIGYNGFEDFIAVPFENPNNWKVKVEDYDGKELNSNFLLGHVLFEWEGNDFVQVIFSEDLVNGDVQNAFNLDPDNYTIASSDSRSIISEKRLKGIIENYQADYESLREDFNLPRRVDFAFSLSFAPGDKIFAEKSIPENLEVVAEQDRIEVLREDGGIVFADYIVKIW